MSIFHYIICGVALLGITAIPQSDAQVLYGSLTGNVTDPATAAVPGVHVEATNHETNVKAETSIDDRGIYRFTNLQPGHYTVTVTASSFRPYSAINVPVQTNQIPRV